jgi:hypothetical protein
VVVVVLVLPLLLEDLLGKLHHCQYHQQHLLLLPPLQPLLLLPPLQPLLLLPPASEPSSQQGCKVPLVACCPAALLPCLRLCRPAAC